MRLGMYEARPVCPICPRRRLCRREPAKGALHAPLQPRQTSSVGAEHERREAKEEKGVHTLPVLQCHDQQDELRRAHVSAREAQ